MIITITGKPCSGKNAVADYFSEKFGFKTIVAGDIFRKIATERGVDILALNRQKDTSIDKFVDEKLIEIGKTQLYNNIVLVSRTAWFLISDSFKVFLDVEPQVQYERLSKSNRSDEVISTDMGKAMADLKERWDLENERYRLIYGRDNTNLSNFDLVIDNSNLSIQQTAEKIYEKYLEFIKKTDKK